MKYAILLCLTLSAADERDAATEVALVKARAASAAHLDLLQRRQAPAPQQLCNCAQTWKCPCGPGCACAACFPPKEVYQPQVRQMYHLAPSFGPASGGSCVGGS